VVGVDTAHAQHAVQAEQVATTGAAAGMPAAELAAVGVHTAAMFLVMGLIAVVIFEKAGLAILRRGWFNLDRVWAGALPAAAAGTSTAWIRRPIRCPTPARSGRPTGTAST
jgi:hypothetical protein